jgi:hypothetical protein
MKLPTLPTLLSALFLRYLAVERGVSPHTTTSYRDAIKLLLQFAALRCRRSVDLLVIEDLTATMVLDFSQTWRLAGATPSAREIRAWRRFKPSFATLQGENQLWLLPAALYCLFPRKRRFVLYWAISVSRSLVICWLKSTAWRSAERAITCSSAYSTTAAPVFKNCST